MGGIRSGGHSVRPALRDVLFGRADGAWSRCCFWLAGACAEAESRHCESCYCSDCCEFHFDLSPSFLGKLPPRISHIHSM